MWILGLGGPSAIHLKVKKWARLKETVYSSPNLKRNFSKTKSDLSLAKLIHTTLKTSSSLQVANYFMVLQAQLDRGDNIAISARL